MELTPLGSVLLGVWIVRLARSLDGVSHTLHDGHNFDGLNIEVVFMDMFIVYLRGRVFP